MTGKILWISSSGRLALPDVRDWSEAFPNVREWSGIYPRCSEGPTGCPVVVGWPSRMSRSGLEALPDVWVWSGDPPGCP